MFESPRQNGRCQLLAYYLHLCEKAEHVDHRSCLISVLFSFELMDLRPSPWTHAHLSGYQSLSDLPDLHTPSIVYNYIYTIYSAQSPCFSESCTHTVFYDSNTLYFLVSRSCLTCLVLFGSSAWIIVLWIV